MGATQGPVRALAYLAGHRDMNITTRYVHQQEQTIRAAMDRRWRTGGILPAKPDKTQTLPPLSRRQRASGLLEACARDGCPMARTGKSAATERMRLRHMADLSTARTRLAIRRRVGDRYDA